MKPIKDVAWSSNLSDSARPVLVVEANKSGKPGKTQKTAMYRALSGVSFQDLDIYVRQTSTNGEQLPNEPIEERRGDSLEGEIVLRSEGQYQQSHPPPPPPIHPTSTYSNDPRYFFQGQNLETESIRQIPDDVQSFHSFPGQYTIPGYSSNSFRQQVYHYPAPPQSSYLHGHPQYGYHESYFQTHPYNTPGYPYHQEQYYKPLPYPPQNFPQPISNSPCSYEQERYYGGQYGIQPSSYSSNYPYSYTQQQCPPPSPYLGRGGTPQIKRKSSRSQPTPFIFPASREAYAQQSESKHLSLDESTQSSYDASEEIKEIRKPAVLSADSLENIHIISEVKLNKDSSNPISPNSLCSPRSEDGRRNSCEYDSLEDVRPKHVSELKTFFESKSSSSSISHEDKSFSREASTEIVSKSELNQSKQSLEVDTKEKDKKLIKDDLIKKDQVIENIPDSSEKAEIDNSDATSATSSSQVETKRNSPTPDNKESHIGDVSFLRATKDTPLTLLASTRLVKATMKPPMKPTTFFIALDSKFEMPVFSESTDQDKKKTDSLSSQINNQDTSSKGEETENIISPLSVSSSEESSSQSATPADYQESQLLLRHFVSDWRCVSPSSGSESDIDEFFLVLDSSGGEAGLGLPSRSHSYLETPKSEESEGYYDEEELDEAIKEEESKTEREKSVIEIIKEEDEEIETESKKLEAAKLEASSENKTENKEDDKGDSENDGTDKTNEALDDPDTFIGNSDISNNQPFLGLGKDRVFASHEDFILPHKCYFNAGSKFTSKDLQQNLIFPSAAFETKNSLSETYGANSCIRSTKKNDSSHCFNSKRKLKDYNLLRNNKQSNTNFQYFIKNKQVSVFKITASRPQLIKMPPKASCIYVDKTGKGRMLNNITFNRAFAEILPITVSLLNESNKLPAHPKASFNAYIDNNISAGTFSATTCSSFHPSKTFSSGEEITQSLLLTPSDLEFLATLIANKIIMAAPCATSLASTVSSGIDIGTGGHALKKISGSTCLKSETLSNSSFDKNKKEPNNNCIDYRKNSSKLLNETFDKKWQKAELSDEIGSSNLICDKRSGRYSVNWYSSMSSCPKANYNNNFCDPCDLEFSRCNNDISNKKHSVSSDEKCDNNSNLNKIAISDEKDNANSETLVKYPGKTINTQLTKNELGGEIITTKEIVDEDKTSSQNYKHEALVMNKENFFSISTKNNEMDKESETLDYVKAELSQTSEKQKTNSLISKDTEVEELDRRKWSASSGISTLSDSSARKFSNSSEASAYADDWEWFPGRRKRSKENFDEENRGEKSRNYPLILRQDSNTSSGVFSMDSENIFCDRKISTSSGISGLSNIKEERKGVEEEDLVLSFSDEEYQIEKELPSPIWPLKYLDKSSERIKDELNLNNKQKPFYGKAFKYIKRNKKETTPSNALRIRRRTLHVFENISYEKVIQSKFGEGSEEHFSNSEDNLSLKGLFDSEESEKTLSDEDGFAPKNIHADVHTPILSEEEKEESKKFKPRASLPERNKAVRIHRAPDLKSEGSFKKTPKRKTKRQLFILKDSKSLPNLSDVGEAVVLDEPCHKEECYVSFAKKNSKEVVNRSLDLLSNVEDIVPRTQYKFNQISFPHVIPRANEEQEISELFSDEDLLSDIDFEPFSDTEIDSSMDNLDLNIFEPKKTKGPKSKRKQNAEEKMKNKTTKKFIQLRRKLSFNSVEKSKDFKESLASSLQRFRKAKDKLERIVHKKLNRSDAIFYPSLKRSKGGNSISLLNISKMSDVKENQQTLSTLRACDEEKESDVSNDCGGEFKNQEKSNTLEKIFFSDKKYTMNETPPISLRSESRAFDQDSIYSWSDADSDFEFLDPKDPNFSLRGRQLVKEIEIERDNAEDLGKIDLDSGKKFLQGKPPISPKILGK